MKILITGANGYLGQGITELLNESKDVKVIATDISTDFLPKKIEKLESNIFEINNPYDYFGKPDILLHLAWRNGFVHNDPSHIDDLNKHYHFIESLIDSGIKQVCILGSVHEVGFFEGSVNETTPTHPQSLYGIAKNALRELVELKCKNSNTIFQWIRGYYIVGNSEHGSSIFSKITKAEKEGKRTFPFTTGLNQFDFLDYDEFCRQVYSVITQNKVNGIINVCSGRPMRLADRVEKFIQDNQYKIKLDYGAFQERPYDSKAIWGDDFKIRVIMGKI